MFEIGRGIGLAQSGDRDGARALFAALWTDLDEHDHLHRCAVAHSMADVQDAPRDALAWDLRALEAAESVTDADTARAGISGGRRALFPSLHLNLADLYVKLDEPDRARAHVARGFEVLEDLDANGYLDTIRSALERIAATLDPG